MSLPLEGLLGGSVEQAAPRRSRPRGWPMPARASSRSSARAEISRAATTTRSTARALFRVAEPRQGVGGGSTSRAVTTSRCCTDDRSADVLIRTWDGRAAQRAGFAGSDARRNPRTGHLHISGYGEEARSRSPCVRPAGAAESGIARLTGSPRRRAHRRCRPATSAPACTRTRRSWRRSARGSHRRGTRDPGVDVRRDADWMAVPLLHYDYRGTVWPRVGLGTSDDRALRRVSTRPTGVRCSWRAERRRVAALRARGARADGLADDPRFATNGARVSHKAELGRAGGRGAREVRQRRAGASGSIAPGSPAVRQRRARVASHPHLRHIEVSTPHGSARMPAPPPVVRGEPREYRPVPALTAHRGGARGVRAMTDKLQSRATGR